MSDPLTKALVISGVAITGLLLWALSIALVLRDLNRRHLPGPEQTAWLVLAALLPFIGGVAYLFSRVLERIFSPHAVKGLEAEDRRTEYKPPDKLSMPLPTVAAADLVRQPAARPNQALHLSQKGGRASLQLEVIAGPLAGRRFSLEALPARIGRGPLVAINLDEDHGVSRYHAEIYESGGTFHVRDLQSTHGTTLNGKDITDESLNPGDHLGVGQSTLVFRMEEQDGST